MTPRAPEGPGDGPEEELGDEPVVEIRPEEAERLLDEAYGSPAKGTSPAGGDGTESAAGSRALLVGADGPGARQVAVDRPVALNVLLE